MKVKTLTRPFEVKEHGEGGTFAGYGSVFGVVDSYSEIVLPGAFADSIAEHKAKKTAPILLWQHDWHEPIGVWDEISEDDHGLLMSGRFAMDTQRGKEAHSLLKMGAIRGLSIGYSVPKGGASFDEDTGLTEISQINLWETSLVTFPANPEAVVTEVRAALDAGTYPGCREFVRWLTRDAGFSQSDSLHIARHGYKSLLTRDADMDASLTHATAAIQKMLAATSKGINK